MRQVKTASIGLWTAGGCALALVLALGAGCATTSPPVTKIVDGKVIQTRAVSPAAYEHVARALLHEEESRWQDAALELQRALQFDDDAPEVNAHLAELFLRLGRVDDAAAEVKRSLSVEATVDGLIADAHVRQARKDRRGALEPLRQAVQMISRDGNIAQRERVHLELAAGQVADLDVDGAHETMRRLTVLAPESVRARIELAALAWALDRTGEAETALREALELEPSQLEALLLLAQLAAAEGRTADAKRRYTETIDRAENPLEIAESFARWLIARGDTDEAHDLADRLVSEEGDAQMLDLGVRLHIAAGQAGRARQIAERGLARGLDSGQMHLLAGAACQEQGGVKEAVEHYLAVPASHHLHLRARLRAASTLREGGQPARAAEVLVGIKGSGEQAVELAAGLSAIDDKQGDFARAARRLDEALQQAPDHAALLLARAALEERRGDWKRAVAFAERILQKEPSSAEALNFIGFVLADHGQELPRATRMLQAALALQPGSGGIIDSLGWAYFKSGDVVRAGELLQQASRLQPNDAEILSHLGDLYVKQQESRRAIDAFQQALAAKPDERVRRTVEDRLRQLGARSSAGR